MSAQARRLAALLIALAALLFAGRWLVTFLADRWWADAVSPAAALYLTRRALLGLALDLAAVAIAIAWFLPNARAALHTAVDVPERTSGGNPAFRRLVRHADATAWVTLGAVMLGLLVGSGASRWTDTVMVAWHGVDFGDADPILGLGVGVYLALLPLWLRLHLFLSILVLGALGLAALTFLLSGAWRVTRRPAITDRARRHLGLLLALLAGALGLSQVLAPYELAAGLPHPVAVGVAELHRSVAFVLVGVCLAAMALSVIWVLRPLHSVVAGAWLLLSAALVGAHYLLPADPPARGDAEAVRARAAMEILAFGLEAATVPVLAPPRYGYWDAGVAGRLVNGTPSAERPVRTWTGPADAGVPVWIVAAQAGDTAAYYAVADDSVTADGAALWRSPDGRALSQERVLITALGPLQVRLRAAPVESGSGPGVEAGGLTRRIALAWALQSWRLIGERPETRVGWNLTPGARLHRLLPHVTWGTPRLWYDEAAGPVWVVDGLATAEAFPLVRRRVWRGREVAYARAGFVGFVHPRDGRVEVFLREDADPLSRAWAEVVGGVVRDAAGLPPAFADRLGYPEELLPLQADLMAAERARGMTADSTVFEPVTDGGRPQVGQGPGRWIVPVVNRPASRLELVVEGSRVAGEDRLTVWRPDSINAPEAPELLARRWQRFPLLQQLRDSVLATGGAWEPGTVRYLGLPDSTVLAYQPIHALDGRGVPRVIAVGVAAAERLGAGRTVEEAWQNMQGTSRGTLLPGDDAALIEELRRWAREADSALRRGDLAGFGRAFGMLRSLLETEPPK